MQPLMPPTKHDELVAIGAKWAAKRCPIVLTELVAFTRETPDVLGFQSKGYKVQTLLIECKASKADFKADDNKFVRRKTEYGMGSYRYYLCPDGLLQPEEIPDKWGLLWAGKNVRCKKQPEHFDKRSVDDEMRILMSALRRIGGVAESWVSIRGYTHQTKCKATLSVEPFEDIWAKVEDEDDSQGEE